MILANELAEARGDAEDNEIYNSITTNGTGSIGTVGAY